MSYVALYRKFRPDNFGEVRGQEHIVTTLKNQIEANRIGHAYLFCGTRGTGKTTIAKIFSKAINCENPVDNSPCCQCSNCKAIAAGASMSVIEIDAASNTGVDSIREIIDEVSFPPADGCKYKVYIIDEVHMLTVNAFNALLKTLEEPPAYCVFILATTDPQKLPITILSRCQRYDFKRLSVDIIADRLEELTQIENVSVEPRALRYIAKVADGAMRDALSMLDQCISFHYGETLTFDNVLNVLGAVDTVVFSNLYRAVTSQDVLACIKILEDVVIQGRDLTQFVIDFTWYLRNLLVVTATEDADNILDMSSENLERIKEEAADADSFAIMRYIRVFSDLSNNIKYAAQKRILVELAIIKLCRPEMERNDDSILDRLRVLEQKIEEAPKVVYASQTVAAPVEQKPPRELPKAIPEDIKLLIESWGRLVNAAQGMIKTSLKNCYPSLDEAGKLKLITRDSFSYNYLNSENSKKDVIATIAAQIEKEVDYSAELIPVDGSMDGVNPNLLQLAGIDIEINSDNIEEDEEYV